MLEIILQKFWILESLEKSNIYDALGHKISYNLHCQKIIPTKQPYISFIIPVTLGNNSTESLES